MAKLFWLLLTAAAQKARGQRVFVLNDPRPTIVVSAEMSEESFRTITTGAAVSLTAAAEYGAYGPMAAQLQSLSAASGSGRLYLQKVMDLGDVDVIFAAHVTGSATDSEPVAADADTGIEAEATIWAPTVVSTKPQTDVRMESAPPVHTPTAHGYGALHRAVLADGVSGVVIPSAPVRLDAVGTSRWDSTAVSIPSQTAQIASETRVEPSAVMAKPPAHRVSAAVSPKIAIRATPDLGEFSTIPVRSAIRMRSGVVADTWDMPVRTGTTLYIRQVNTITPDGNTLSLT